MVDIMLTIRLASTALTAPMARKAHTDYDNQCTVDVNEKKTLLFHCKPYHIEVESKNIRPKNFEMKSFLYGKANSG